MSDDVEQSDKDEELIDENRRDYETDNLEDRRNGITVSSTQRGNFRKMN